MGPLWTPICDGMSSQPWLWSWVFPPMSREASHGPDRSLDHGQRSGIRLRDCLGRGPALRHQGGQQGFCLDEPHVPSLCTRSGGTDTLLEA